MQKVSNVKLMLQVCELLDDAIDSANDNDSGSDKNADGDSDSDGDHDNCGV